MFTNKRIIPTRLGTHECVVSNENRTQPNVLSLTARSLCMCIDSSTHTRTSSPHNDKFVTTSVVNIILNL